MSKPDLATLRAMLANKAAVTSRSFVASDSDSNTAKSNTALQSSALTPQALRSKALQYLARRDYARAELRQKLIPHAENPEDIESLLDDFAARGWLSDARFAEQWTHQRANRYGPQRLKQELKQKGVDQETIAHALESITDSEEVRARAVWQKRFGALPADTKEKGRQLRFLAARGFSFEVIYKIVGSEAEDCDT